MVLLNGLQSVAKYNGRLCRLGNFDSRTGRYAVFFSHPFEDEEGIRVKAANLIWIADVQTIKKGARVCYPEYMYSYMMYYANAYADLPHIDISAIVQQVASSRCIVVEDRTEELEKIQVEARFHSNHASKVFIKAAEDAMRAEGRVLILFRRTLLSNASFMSFMLSYPFFGAEEHPLPWDFKLYVNDDYLHSQKGSGLSSEHLSLALRSLLGDQATTCSICMEDFGEEEFGQEDIGKQSLSEKINSIVIDCGHRFHVHCFQNMLDNSTSPSCPNCRTPYTTRISDGRFAALVGDPQRANDAIDAVTHGVTE